MEENQEIFGMLDLILRPGFCVKNNVIVKVNPSAQGLPIAAGTDVRTLLQTGENEYAAFEEGCLYVQLSLLDEMYGASITRMDGWDIFVLDPQWSSEQLQILALAARELRQSLSNVMIASNQLFPLVEQRQPQIREQSARLNRSLHQMLRVIGNMSDAGRYATSSRQEVRDVGQIFLEIMSKCQALAEQAGIALSYQGLDEEIMCLVDAEQLERALLNLLSNSMKFTPRGESITVCLSRSGRMLRLSVQDCGSGIAENIRNSLFSRYLRQPCLEDSRYGIGLGMVLVRSTAVNHGGTVLIDQPNDKGTRITMTLAIRQNNTSTLRSPILHPDYAGGWDHGLIELAECLPLQAYETDK